MVLGKKRSILESVSGSMTSVYCNSSKARIGSHSSALTKICAPNVNKRLLIQ
jgi:hypothetical protein